MKVVSEIKMWMGKRKDLANESVLSFGVAGASQMHKGIPHLHSGITWTEVAFTGSSVLTSVVELIFSLEIESVTTLVPFETAVASSLLNLHSTKYTNKYVEQFFFKKYLI